MTSQQPANSKVLKLGRWDYYYSHRYDGIFFYLFMAIGGKDMYWIYEYIYKITRGLSMCFYARDDETMEEMLKLYKEGTSDIKGIFYKFKKKRKIFIDEPPYEMEQSQIEILKRGIEKKNSMLKENSH